MAWPISDRMRRALTAGWQDNVLEVDVQVGGVTVATDLQVLPGASVTVDRSADVRRKCSLTVVGVPRELIPTSRRRSPLDVYGGELIIRKGLRLLSGAEVIPQGVLEITESWLTDTAEGVALALTAQDRAGTINDRQLINLWATPFGSTAGDAIEALAEDRYPGVPVSIELSSADEFPTHVIEEKGHPWADGIAAFAEDVGGEAFADRVGRIIARDVPDPSTQPVAWRMVEGDDCTVTKLERGHSRGTGGVNVVVVSGESVDVPPVRAVAMDLDPQSATFVYGPYGPHPVWIESPLIITVEQAQAVADARGRELFGITEVIKITCVANPAIDEGDLIYLRRERSDFDDVVIVDAFSMPLGHDGSMTLTCWVRRQVVTT